MRRLIPLALPLTLAGLVLAGCAVTAQPAASPSASSLSAESSVESSVQSAAEVDTTIQVNPPSTEVSTV